MKKLIPWIKALRLQFYPMTFISYATGAYAARHMGLTFDFWLMMAGYLFLFVLEVATVFSNEYYDFESDIQNKNYSPFNGGSRVLAEGLISFRALKRAINTCILALIPLFLLLNYLSPASTISNLIVCLLTTILALGYTIPPLKLSWRGLGEIDVAITHSIAVMLCGFVFQGGAFNNALVWLISIPLFFSIVPAIILSGIPDYEADKAAGKKAIPVQVGKNAAAIISICSVLLAVTGALLLKHSSRTANVFGNAIYFSLPHAIFLSILIFRFYRLETKPGRIDGIMVASLLYIFWFGITPLVGVSW